MDTRKIASEYRMAQRAQMLQTKQESGQSVKAFCEGAGISRNTYFYWQRKLREAACTELVRRTSPMDKEPVPAGWTQLEVREASRPEGSVRIEVSGCQVIATVESDPELLAKVCRALKAL